MPDPSHTNMITQSDSLKKLLAEQDVKPHPEFTRGYAQGLITSGLAFLLFIFVFVSCSVKASASEPLDIERLLPALEKVESNGNPNAIGDKGKAYGILQIWEVVIVDVNRVFKTKYTHADAFDPVKARDICRKYLAIYATEKRLGRKPTMEDAARIWNGGPQGHKKDNTIKYWQKVAKALK